MMEPIQIIDVPHKQGHQYQSRPVIYDTDRRTLYRGQPGGYHTDLMDGLTQFLPVNPEEGKRLWYMPQGKLHPEVAPTESQYTGEMEEHPEELQWFGTPPENHEEIHNLLGVPPYARHHFRSAVDPWKINRLQGERSSEPRTDWESKWAPMWYHPEKREVHIAPYGWHHHDIVENLGWPSYKDWPQGFRPTAIMVEPQFNFDPAKWYEGITDQQITDRIAEREDPNKQWKFEAKTRSLYHGTLIDHKPLIEEHGLQPQIGPFVSDAYGVPTTPPPDDDEPEAYEDYASAYDPLVFLTDRQRLSRALIAMRHHIGEKLNKPFHHVTPLDVQQHGLLVKVPGQEGASDDPTSIKHQQFPYHWDEGVEEPWETDDWVRYHGQPMSEGTAAVEPGDFYSSEPVTGPPGKGYGLEYIQGPTLTRMLKRENLIPWWNPYETVKKQVYAAHQISWQPGSYGKGLIDELDNVHTWPVENYDGMPTHMNYAKEKLGYEPEEYVQSPLYDTSFTVSPSGHVNMLAQDDWDFDEGHADEIRRAHKVITAADPRLTMAPTGEGKWRFAYETGEHIDEWNPGTDEREREEMREGGPNQEYDPQMPYYPETGEFTTWQDDTGLTHLDVAREQAGMAYHFVIYPDGEARNQGLFGPNLEGGEEGDREELAQALSEHGLRLQPTDTWNFGPTEPMPVDPDTDEGRHHNVTIENDVPGL